MAFISLSGTFLHWRRNPVCLGDIAHLCNATPTCCSADPAFLSQIRTSLASTLSAKNLGIHSVDWKERHLTISVTSLDDLRGVPNCAGTTIDDCAYASTVIGEYLDSSEVLGEDHYTLEVTTPGTKDELTKDREFEAFKGFRVKVTTSEPVKGHSEFVGTLQGRSDAFIIVNVKGRNVNIPRQSVLVVKLVSES